MKKKFLTLMALLCLLNGARADEGMWMLSHLSPQSMKIMKSLGLQMNEKDLYNPKGHSLKDAVVSFGGFCSGVVVSPDGLVFTNHHCGFGHIQALSTPQNDILKSGFVAQSISEELPAKDLFVSILQYTEDVTPRIAKALKKADKRYLKTATEVNEKARAKYRLQALDSMYNVIIEESQKKNPGMRCELEEYYLGNAYYINVYKDYNDIRLVLAPPQSLGKFGGETDNWMWPRQTCDFSVFRIYANADNQPADYSPENRPLKTDQYAKVSLDGYQKGDYCMTIGYPGRTNRYLSSYGITERMQNDNEARINVRGVKQNVWKKWMDSDPAIRLQYAAKYASSSNYWKNSIGMNKALTELNVVAQKQDLEKKITTWASKKKSTNERFGQVLPELEKAYTARKDADYAMAFLSESFFGGPDILRIARYYQALQEAKSDKSRLGLKKRIRSQFKDWNQQVDRETMTALIENYAQQVKAEFLPDFYQTIKNDFQNNAGAYVDALFKQTALTDTNCINVQATPEEMEKDMALVCLKSILKTGGQLSSANTAHNQTVLENERKLCQAILEMDMDSPHYSDANSTMRISYGMVNDYTSAAGHQNYFTTMPSLLDKIAQSHKNEEYKVEPEIKTLFEKGDFGPYIDKNNGEMQLCFLTNNDITGGNSGSPMFNGKGELIGLAFDGNWDAMSNDISFDKELTRCIGVDIRYVLYIIDRWGKANRLIEEINAQ